MSYWTLVDGDVLIGLLAIVPAQTFLETETTQELRVRTACTWDVRLLFTGCVTRDYWELLLLLIFFKSFLIDRPYSALVVAFNGCLHRIHRCLHRLLITPSVPDLRATALLARVRSNLPEYFNLFSRVERVGHHYWLMSGHWRLGLGLPCLPSFLTQSLKLRAAAWVDLLDGGERTHVRHSLVRHRIYSLMWAASVHRFYLEIILRILRIMLRNSIRDKRIIIM